MYTRIYIYIYIYTRKHYIPEGLTELNAELHFMSAFFVFFCQMSQAPNTVQLGSSTVGVESSRRCGRWL